MLVTLRLAELRAHGRYVWDKRRNPEIAGKFQLTGVRNAVVWHD